MLVANIQFLRSNKFLTLNVKLTCKQALITHQFWKWNWIKSLDVVNQQARTVFVLPKWTRWHLESNHCETRVSEWSQTIQSNIKIYKTIINALFTKLFLIVIQASYLRTWLRNAKPTDIHPPLKNSNCTRTKTRRAKYMENNTIMYTAENSE